MSPILRIGSVALLLLAAACSRGAAMDVDSVPLGSAVAVTRADGGVVQGTLAQRDAAAVKIDSGRTTRSVPRDTIADVRLVTEAPVVLPPVARFREYTVPEGTSLHVRLDTSVGSATIPPAFSPMRDGNTGGSVETGRSWAGCFRGCPHARASSVTGFRSSRGGRFSITSGAALCRPAH